MIKFLIGGSPCTYWSIAKRNRETEAAGEGWELFKNYLIAREKFQPDFFLYENNQSAAAAIKDQISLELGVPLQYINSALVSAQQRKRFYCHNFGDVPQPEDRGIVLQDILETGIAHKEKAYTLRASAGTKQGQCNIIRHIQSNGQFGYMGICDPVRVGTMPNKAGEIKDNQSRRVYAADGKSVSICANVNAGSCSDTSSNRTGLYAIPVRIGTIENAAACPEHDSKQYRVYSTLGKSTTICGEGGGVGAKTGLYACQTPQGTSLRPVYTVENGQIEIKGELYPIKLPDGLYIIRKLSVVECCRLQTLPDDYCRAVSATRAYQGLGNGWTAEVIIHLLAHALNGIPKDEEIVVLSMYDGIGTGRYCFDALGYKNVTYCAYEIDKYAMTIARSNYPDIVQCGDAFVVRENSWMTPKTREAGYV